MTATKTLYEDFTGIVELPDFLIPWVDRFYEPREIELLHLLKGDALDAAEVETRWAGSPGGSCPANIETFLERSYKRGVLDRSPQRRFTSANFHTRYDIWALFESWQDIPADVRDSLNRWELNYYISEHRRWVDDLKQGNRRDTKERWPEYLLPHEAAALIDAVDHVYLWPCNCRAMFERCRKPKYTCLRFSNNRGIGWEISKPRAREIMREANQKGLMQNGEISVSPDGRIGGALCNCCADCCFPHLLAEPLDAQKLWPLSRYAAVVDIESCTACGRCVRRCPFTAISLDVHDDEQEKSHIAIDPDLCRGCGVCGTGCKETAISMIKLDEVDSLFDKLGI